MNWQTILSFLSRFSVWTLAKIFSLTFLLFYSVFAGVMVRQTQLLTEALDIVHFSPILKFLAWIHLGVAVALFLLGIFLL